MGLGPNKSRLAPRVRVTGLAEVTDLDKWAQDKQIERTTARSFSQSLRRAGGPRKGALPKVPKPRRHKHHCLCQSPINEECCRCLPRPCLKPKKKGTQRGSKGTNATQSS